MHPTLSRRAVAAALAALPLIVSVPAAQAQAFPSRPITFVVPFAAGSATDQPARALAQAVSAVVARLHDLLAAATASAPARSFFESTGSEAFITTPDGLAKFQQQESAKRGRIVKAAAIEPE